MLSGMFAARDEALSTAGLVKRLPSTATNFQESPPSWKESLTANGLCMAPLQRFREVTCISEDEGHVGGNTTRS